MNNKKPKNELSDFMREVINKPAVGFQLIKKRNKSTELKQVDQPKKDETTTMTKSVQYLIKTSKDMADRIAKEHTKRLRQGATYSRAELIRRLLDEALTDTDHTADAPAPFAPRRLDTERFSNGHVGRRYFYQLSFMVIFARG